VAELYPALDEANVAKHADRKYGMLRAECSASGVTLNLGHVFPDGPRPTGLRYRMNSARA